jgi:hypothetical protein
MIFQNQFLAVVGIALVALHLGTEPGNAGERNRPIESGGPPELINQPVCWSADEPDPFRHCDFAQRG